jgi:hypothetical protein
MTSNTPNPNSERSQATRFILTRLVACLAIGVGSGAFATTTEAAVITIDVSAISGVNGGVGAGSFLFVNSWPVADSGRLLILNNATNDGVYGLAGQSSLAIAAGSTIRTPVKFLAGSVVDATAGGNPNGWNLTGFNQSAFRTQGSSLPDFGPGSYLGVKDAAGRYGYIEVTWNSSTLQFQILSAAYESQAGVGIAIPGGAVPEPGTTGLAGIAMLAIGSAAMLKRRRRQRTATAQATA